MTASITTADFSDLSQCNSSTTLSENETVYGELPNNTGVPRSISQSSSNQPNIKVIPISLNKSNLPVESTTSSIEDILADKVERIAAHLEKANSNILHVDNRIRSFRTEHNRQAQESFNHEKSTHENIQTLTDLRDQIDARLKEQAVVNQNLNKSIKSLKNVNEKPTTHPNLQPNINPVYNASFPMQDRHVSFNEDTQTFLDRIRREADQRVNDALRSVQHDTNDNTSKNVEILAKLESILQQQELDKNKEKVSTELEMNKQMYETQTEKLAKNVKMYAEDRNKLKLELKSAQLEIAGLKSELENLKREIHLNNLHKMQNFEHEQTNKKENDTQIQALKSTLQSLISSRAELENNLEAYKSKCESMQNDHDKTIGDLRRTYENEIAEYQREYDRQLRNIQNHRDSDSESLKTDLHQIRKENEQLRKKVSFLAHEVEQRDIQIADVRSSFNLLQNRPNIHSHQIEDRGFLVSLASILNDLVGKNGHFIDAKQENLDNLKKDIIHELASGVERVSLAEKMQLKAEIDRKEMKEKVKVLLDRIDKEKRLQIEANSMQNERAFQDTIHVLQNELERTRKQIKQQNKNYSR